MKYLASILLTLALALLPVGVAVYPQSASASVQTFTGHPTITILSVVRDKTVTIRANHLPPHDEFRVRMGEMGTRAVGGTVVGSFSTDDHDSMKLTFDIPSEFHGDFQVAIRIESRTGSHFFAFNWFFNNTSGAGSGGTHRGHPTIRILSVNKNNTVTVRLNNLPAHDTFRVQMGRFGTRAKNGIRVDTFSTGSGGNRTMKFTIPSSLRGLSRIAIRIQSTTGSGFFAFNWFFNR